MRNDSLSHSLYINWDKNSSSKDEGIEIKEFCFFLGPHIFIVVLSLPLVLTHVVGKPKRCHQYKQPPQVQCQYLFGKHVSNFKVEHLAISHNSKTNASIFSPQILVFKSLFSKEIV